MSPAIPVVCLATSVSSVSSRRRGTALAFAWAAWIGVACNQASPVQPTGPAQRVVSQTVQSDEILWDLGPEARSRVLAVSTLADDPRYSRVAAQWPVHLPRLAVTSEGLLATSPDLIILASFTAPEIRTLLASQRLRLLELDGFAGFADYRRHILEIADALALPANGQRMVADLDRELAAMATTRPAVALTAVAWGHGHAGVVNLPERDGLTGHVPVATERLLVWDPDLIVVSCPALVATDPACGAAAEALRAEPGLAHTRAASHDGIVTIPGRDLGSAGAGMIDAARHLQDHAHRVLARRAAP